MKTTHMLRKQVKKGNVGSLGKHTGIQLSTVIWGIRNESAYSKLFQEEKKADNMANIYVVFQVLDQIFCKLYSERFFFFKSPFYNICVFEWRGEGKFYTPVPFLWLKNLFVRFGWMSRIWSPPRFSLLLNGRWWAHHHSLYPSPIVHPKRFLFQLPVMSPPFFLTCLEASASSLFWLHDFPWNCLFLLFFWRIITETVW